TMHVCPGLPSRRAGSDHRCPNSGETRVVGDPGLEPGWVAPHAPQTCASTSSASRPCCAGRFYRCRPPEATASNLAMLVATEGTPDMLSPPWSDYSGSCGS